MPKPDGTFHGIENGTRPTGRTDDGGLATMWDKYEDKSNFFWVNFVLLAISATVLYLMLPWLKRVFQDSGVH